MRTRYMTLEDYGVPKDKIQWLMDYCHGNLTPEEQAELARLSASVTGLEIPIYKSITAGYGYRTMIKMGIAIHIGEDDFYAYRRKVLAEFYQYIAKRGGR